MLLRRRRADQRGYTLMELMIVVAIIGILASIGTYSVVKYVRAARTAEAIELINSIRAAQESYKDETFGYLNVSAGDIESVFPFTNEAELKNQSKGWGAGNSTILGRFAQLGVQPSTRVQFGYSCVAANGGTLPTKTQLRVDTSPLPSSAPASWWYVVRAVADRDSDGKFATLVGSSFNDQIYTERDTE
jgi:prepilin-type N-terminal cleavage/methylation domain-containing protein